MNNFDYTWQNPPKEQLALANMFANVSAMPKGIKPRQVLEFIAFAEYSLWYLEVKRYADNIYPMDLKRDSIKFFMEGCNNICTLVEKGYDEESGSWWHLKTPVTDDEFKTVNRFFIAIANCCNTLQLTYANQPIMVDSYEILARIILGNEWKQKFTGLVEHNKAKNNGKQKSTSKE